MIVFLKASTNNKAETVLGYFQNAVHQYNLPSRQIERLWRDVNRVICSRFLNIFLFLEQRNLFDPSNELHFYCLHLVYVKLINKALEEFIGQWNNHPVSTECNFTPNQLWVQGMLNLRNSCYSAVSSVIEGEVPFADIEMYGVDEEELLPNEQEDYAVVVPDTRVPLSDIQVQQLSEACNDIQESVEGGNGIASYQLVHEVL
ncbi:Hypothetical predicted protein [Paramuricea clavata]|uniref:Integrase core domain-containing protein n=1 Tax=Paramuricea clavata TaxID=317549 RepID=A0A6S7K5C3_PARCT|nr:Hypothetical predicted protein [Paramuricea clavata]